MTIPAITQTELDGALGILPPASGKLLAVIGVSSGGTVDTPATYGNAKAMIADLGVGPLVEAAARHIETTGDPVVIVRTAQTTTGDMGTIDDSGVAGTAQGSITQTAATEPLDDYEVVILIVTGGTTGTTGITYKYSLDGGNNWSLEQALGTSLTLAISGTGVSFDIVTAKTFVAADTFNVVCTAPAPTAAELGAAIDALKNSAVSWELCHIAAPVDATNFDTIETKFAALQAAGKYRAWIGSVAVPTAAQTEATYLTALTSAFAAKETIVGELCAGACNLISSVSGRKYRRPVSFAVASLEASVAEHIDIADVNLGSIKGCSIRDDNGNPDEHDETVNPGLDDLGFTVLRTWEGRGGVFVNVPNLFSAADSDFDIMPKRRVMNLARAATRSYLERRLNQSILVDPTTGFILEAEALEIEAGGRAALQAVLGPAPKASSWSFVVARNDNILSTKTITVTVRVVPLGYVEAIDETIGFLNPALQVQAA